MGALGFLSSMGLTPTEKRAELPTAPQDCTSRFFRLNEDLEARFPGTEVKVMSWRMGKYWNLECEIKGRRPDGTYVSFKAESKAGKSETETQLLERFFKEVDSWA